jgi:hypothetical protein
MIVTRSAAWAILVVMLLAGYGCNSPSDQDAAVAEPEETTGVDDAQPPTEGDEDTSEPLRTATVEIYFPSALSDGLVGEFREIFDTATPGDRAKQIIADLISGPSSDDCLRAVSPSTRLRQAYVLDDGTAYLDFSSELTEGVGGGSMMEVLTVYAIVDSVALGVREVQRVGLLVNGRPLETMNGHLDLSRPLKPNPRLILGSIIVDAGSLAPTPGIAD